MDQTADNRLQQAKKILLIPTEEMDIDVLAATFALALALKQQRKQIGMYISPEIYTEAVKSKFPPQNMRFLKKDEPGSYVITLDNIDASVKEVKWKERGGKVNIFVTTEKGDLSKEKISINQLNAGFDFTILIGHENPKLLGEFFENHQSMFGPSRTLIISKNEPPGEYKLVLPVLSPTYSEAIYNVIISNKLQLNGAAATNLLAGIYWRTNSFRSNLTDTTFTLPAELVKRGADQERARNIAMQTVTFAGSAYFADVYGNIKAAGQGIFYAVIPEVRLKPNGKRVMFTNVVPIAEIIGCQVAFVIVHSKDTNTVYLQSTSSQFDITSIVAKYNGEGDKSTGTFSTKAPLSKLEESLLAEIKRSLGSPVEIPSKPSTTEAVNGKQRQEAPKQPSTPKTERPKETPEPAPNKIVTEKKPAARQKPQQASPEVPDFLKHGVPDTPPDSIQQPSTGGDPLAAAKEVPEPLKLHNEEAPPANLTPPAPNTPLPPASIR